MPEGGAMFYINAGDTEITEVAVNGVSSADWRLRDGLIQIQNARAGDRIEIPGLHPSTHVVPL